MKKTLKVIASAAVAMSAFASVAMADDAATTTSTTTTDSSATATTTAPKTSADFKDLADVDAGLKAKIDALLKAGVFEGTADDQFGINENMTRAQFAKVLDLIYNVNVDMSVKSSSFSDVKADDQANGWAIPYIEAAKKAGLIDGVSDTTFVPGDNVTLGQFATALVKGLGVKPDVTGTPWYADAVKQAIAKNVLPADTDGSKVATRADLVVGAYGGQQAYQEINKPAKASVVSAKATGVKSVTVTLNRDVDTSKATVSLKKGTVDVATTATWSDDKKSVVLALTDAKIMAGDYTVTLGGLDAADIDTATATFTAQDEQLQKIEFVTASDEIAYSNGVIIKAKATNQYGENASFSAGAYTVYTSGASFTKITKSDSDGLLNITLKTDETGVQQGVTTVPVTIVNNDQHVTVQKNFKVGTAPIISKLELGSPVYSSGNDSLAGKGENVKYQLNLFDQYGGIIAYDSKAFTDLNSDPDKRALVIMNDYLDQNNYKTEIEDDGNNVPELKFSLIQNVDKSADYTFTVTCQAASASGKVSIKSAKIATKIVIGDLGDVIATGDKEAYIPVIAYDAEGNELSVEDLTDKANVDRIKVTVSGDSGLPSSRSILDAGEHKGTIPLKSITAGAKSSISVTAVIASPNATSTATKTYTVADVRVPDHFREATAPAKELVAGGFTKLKYEVYDQYGKKMKDGLKTDGNGGYGTDVEYYVAVTGAVYNGSTLVSSGTGFFTNDKDQGDSALAAVNASNTDISLPGFTGVTGTVWSGVANTADYAGTGSAAVAANNGQYNYDKFASTFRVYSNATDPVGTSYKLNLKIYKHETGKTPIEISHKDLTFDVVNASTSDLTYNVNTIGTLFNTMDNGVVISNVYGPGPDNLYNDVGDLKTVDTVEKDVSTSDLAKEVTLSVTNAAGDKVGIPYSIKAITTSDQRVARVSLRTSNGNTKAYVLGNKTGTATITVTYLTAKGEQKQSSQTITVKSDPLAVDHLEAGNDSESTTVTSGFTDTNAFGLMDLKIYDNYGTKYDGKQEGKVQRVNYLYGVVFVATHVKYVDHPTSNAADNNVIVDNNGYIQVGANVKSFDLQAVAPNGQSAVTAVTITGR